MASAEPVGGAHEARNEGAVPVEYYLPFFGRAGAPILMDAPAPSTCR